MKVREVYSPPLPSFQSRYCLLPYFIWVMCYHPQPKWRQTKMKIPKLGIFMAGLETAFIISLYFLHNWALNNFRLGSAWWTSGTKLQIWIDPTSSGILFFLFSNGIVLLTVGLCGFGRQYFKSHQNVFTAIAAILVPSILLSFLYSSLSNLIF